MIEVLSGSGRSIGLGREVGRGGEGSVFEVQSEPNLAAKIFHSALPADKAEKIRVMAGMRTDRIERLTAWPLDLLSLPSGEAVGVLMPRVSGHRLVHELYSPKSRRVIFERGDWRFLIRTAANTARAFAAVHEAGCVIGDVNQGGILVAEDASVRLIDCDSFQVIAGPRQFLCDVGMETFTPPELQGKPFQGVVRTQNHDNFGLAVLVFLMLFMGRHPFAGKFLGRGDMPIGKAIAQGRFAYGPRHSLTQMEKPPGAPDLSIVGDHAALFERAFTPVAASGGRPTAREWVRSLTQLERKLTHCAVNPSHWYLNTLDGCPWCAMENQVGIPLFPVDISQAPGSLFNLSALWREIDTIKQPVPLPAIEISVVASSAARTVGRARRLRTIAAASVAGFSLGLTFGDPALVAWRWPLAAAGVAAFIAIMAVFARREEVLAFATRRQTQAARWASVWEEWVKGTDPHDFDTRLKELERLTREHSALPEFRRRSLERRQRQRFLERFRIDNIGGLSTERKRILTASGLETAADLTPERLGQIEHLGRRGRTRVAASRRRIENKFAFDPEEPIDQMDLANIEQEAWDERWRIESAMVKGVAELKAIKAGLAETGATLINTVRRTKRDYLQAVANHRAARGRFF